MAGSVAVIALHTAGLALAAAGGVGADGALALVLIDSAGRFAVPMFFAVAAWATLVASPPADGSQLLTRAWRVCVPMAVWTAVHLLLALARGEIGAGGAAELAIDALGGPIRPAFHLWYLYAYVPFVLLLGGVVLLLRKALSFRLGVLLLAVAVAPTVLPTLPVPGDDALAWKWMPALYQVLYGLVGAAVLASDRRILPRWAWLIVFGASVAGIAVFQLLVQFPAPYSTIPVAASMLALIQAIRGVPLPSRIRRITIELGRASFGAYLVHLALLQTFFWVVPLDPANGWTTLLVCCAAIGIAVPAAFGISLGIGRLGLRRWLG